ncbi:MAG TPA: hypothetical protein VMA13_05335 [Candidatus Saccharimonadales bacterium]|nr:hypothetical protein [Candidatus Saccharimonadales bacterium]
MTQNSVNLRKTQPLAKTQVLRKTQRLRVSPGRIVSLKKAEGAQTFTKVFRWRLPDGQPKPATVEIAGTFTKWERVPLPRDAAQDTWQVMLHQIPFNRTHRYMLFVDGKPTQDKHCDGLAIPQGLQEEQCALPTARGPRVFMLFAQTK